MVQWKKLFSNLSVLAKGTYSLLLRKTMFISVRLWTDKKTQVLRAPFDTRNYSAKLFVYCTLTRLCAFAFTFEFSLVAIILTLMLSYIILNISTRTHNQFLYYVLFSLMLHQFPSPPYYYPQAHTPPPPHHPPTHPHTHPPTHTATYITHTHTHPPTHTHPHPHTHTAKTIQQFS